MSESAPTLPDQLGAGLSIEREHSQGPLRANGNSWQRRLSRDIMGNPGGRRGSYSNERRASLDRSPMRRRPSIEGYTRRGSQDGITPAGMDLVRRLSQSGVSPALLGLPAQPAAVNQNDEAAVDAEIERLCECLQQGNMGPFAFDSDYSKMWGAKMKLIASQSGDEST